MSQLPEFETRWPLWLLGGVLLLLLGLAYLYWIDPGLLDPFTPATGAAI